MNLSILVLFSICVIQIQSKPEEYLPARSNSHPRPPKGPFANGGYFKKIAKKWKNKKSKIKKGMRPMKKGYLGVNQKKGNNDDQRIVGGKNAKKGQFPFQLSIRCYDYHTCGAQLYNERIAITAAHCCAVFNTSMCSDIELTGGTIHASAADSQTRKVSDWRIHPKYEGSNFHNDICLLSVNEPFKIDGKFLKTIPLGDESTCKDHSDCQVSGWGRLEYNGEMPEDLMYADVPILPNSACSGLQEFQASIMICAGYLEGGIDACQADSGGPLSCYGKLCGIVSFGFECARKDFPGVYSRVSTYVDWVTQVSQEM